MKARRHRHRVPVLIDDGEVTGVARVRGLAGKNELRFGRTADAIFREQPVPGDLNEVHVAQILFAIGISQLCGADAEVAGDSPSVYGYRKAPSHWTGAPGYAGHRR